MTSARLSQPTASIPTGGHCICTWTLGAIPRWTHDQRSPKKSAASEAMKSQMPEIRFFLTTSVCIPMSDSMMQSRHQAVAVTEEVKGGGAVSASQDKMNMSTFESLSQVTTAA